MTLYDRCRGAMGLILDVDGVLTPGGITYLANGTEIKEFHVRDGSAIKLWRGAGKKVAILSGRTSEVTLWRARELGINHVKQGDPEKIESFHALLEDLELVSSQVAYLGDDSADVPILEESLLGIAVADACTEAKLACHHITKTPGGRGAVRETIELILRCQGKWANSPSQKN
jgi:3-deoxy-D-manno-octulosonate 8-phosphate phosphatase (KDO 8-P phosphatase)